jgi:hypothetical protein
VFQLRVSALTRELVAWLKWQCMRRSSCNDRSKRYNIINLHISRGTSNLSNNRTVGHTKYYFQRSVEWTLTLGMYSLALKGSRSKINKL